jgi:hypothetical protein
VDIGAGLADNDPAVFDRHSLSAMLAESAYLVQTNLFVAALPGLLGPMQEFLKGTSPKKKR